MDSRRERTRGERGIVVLYTGGYCGGEGPCKGIFEVGFVE
jgi:hypothetical protein